MPSAYPTGGGYCVDGKWRGVEGGIGHLGYVVGSFVFGSCSLWVP